MAVLALAGTMGLQWVLLIAAVVAIEKLTPNSRLTSRAVGVALTALALGVFIQPDLVTVLRGHAM